MRLLSAVWRQLPVVVRAVLTGALVAIVGQLPRNTLFLTNIKRSPSIPWAVVLMSGYLWLFWQYLGGRGWPKSTAEARRRNLRGQLPPRSMWPWVLLAGGFASVCLRALLDVCRRLSTRPAQDLLAPEQLNRYPFFTVLLLFLMTAAIAGIVEEAAFRGYMQAPIERRHGPVVAIVLVAIVFSLAHYRPEAPDPWPWLIFVPAYFAVAIALGALTYLAASIVPAIVCHAAIDAVALLQYWQLGIPKSVWQVGFDASFWTRCAVVAVSGTAAFWAYRRLAAVHIKPDALSSSPA